PLLLLPGSKIPLSVASTTGFVIGQITFIALRVYLCRWSILGMMSGNDVSEMKKPPGGGFTTLLIALIILLYPNGTRSGT
ncbi:hypothetical protein, partial [Klebsiella aerogenes]|uniref:hypothetical protein n=1 Tax=Klebsiella aerogenes TaxID=548 RepID=UPI00195548C1